MNNRIRFGIVLAVLAFGRPLQAQVGEEGRITARSDVRMSIEGAPGTSGRKLDAMAQKLGTPLGEVKRCYAELVKEHPEVVGSLGVELDLPDGKGPVRVRVPDAVGKLKPMERCIDKAFGKLDLNDVPRPAAAKVNLELTNSSASSVDDVRASEEEASRVKVVQGADGSFESNGQSTQGEVSFRVVSRDNAGSALVERVHNGVRDALPSLFDCRRRAGKKASPEGDLVFKLRLSPSAKPDVSMVSSSVPSERAPICTENALKGTLAKAGKGSAEVTIHFAP